MPVGRRLQLLLRMQDCLAQPVVLCRTLLSLFDGLRLHQQSWS